MDDHFKRPVNDNNNENDENNENNNNSPSLTFVSPSLTFEEAGCLKNLPATSKGGRPHSDIVQTSKPTKPSNSVEIFGAIALLL